MNVQALLHKTTSNQSFHLAHSSAIGHAAICSLKFKLPNIMGASREGQEFFLPGTIVHRVLEQASSTFLDLWRSHATSTQIEDAWLPYLEQVIDNMKWEEYRINNPEDHVATSRSRLSDIANVLSNKMLNDSAPNRILTEITITNPAARHEGRIDAIFEFSNRVETVEWKTYADKGISPYDRYQTISNGMLVNYRYNKPENDFSNNTMSIITPSKIHHPKPTLKSIIAITQARNYILSELRGEKPKTKLPYFAVCETCAYLDPCRFYMTDTTSVEHRRLLWNRRFRVLKKREKTHMNKILFDHLTFDQLRELNIADSGYSIKEIIFSDGIATLKLEKNDNIHRLYKGDNLRIIAIEPNIPILGCISCTGTMREINHQVAIVDVYMGNPNQLTNLPIILLKTDVDLTKRELEAIDTIHRSGGRLQKFAYGLLGESN